MLFIIFWFFLFCISKNQACKNYLGLMFQTKKYFNYFFCFLKIDKNLRVSNVLVSLKYRFTGYEP